MSVNGAVAIGGELHIVSDDGHEDFLQIGCAMRAKYWNVNLTSSSKTLSCLCQLDDSDASSNTPIVIANTLLESRCYSTPASSRVVRRQYISWIDRAKTLVGTIAAQQDRKLDFGH